MGTTFKTIADFRRAAVPGSRWICRNYLHPHVSGLRVITKGRTIYSYEATKVDGSVIRNGRLELPTAAVLRPEGRSLHFLYGPGDDRVCWTWTLIEQDDDVASAEAEPVPSDLKAYERHA